MELKGFGHGQGGQCSGEGCNQPQAGQETSAGFLLRQSLVF